MAYLGKGYSFREGAGETGDKLSTDCRDDEAMAALFPKSSGITALQLFNHRPPPSAAQ